MVGERLWFTLDSGLGPTRTTYRGRNFIRAYDQWICGDPTGNELGTTTQDIGSHYGAPVSWEFSTRIAYNKGDGAIFHSLELAGLTGSVAPGADPRIRTSYSADGVTWSQDRSIPVGMLGQRLKRLQWRRLGRMSSQRIQRFQGDSDAHITVARLEAAVEPLQF